MSEIIEQVYCPNCDYRLELETHPGSYAILDGHAELSNVPGGFSGGGWGVGGGRWQMRA